MSVVCYEISKEQVKADNRLTNDCCVDYLSPLVFSSIENLEGDARKEALEQFLSHFPKRMFTRVSEDAFRYNGGYEKLEMRFTIEIKNLMANVPGHDVLDSAEFKELSYRMGHPLGDVLFYFGDIYPAVETGLSFMRTFLKQLRKGEIVYIGGCVEFCY